MHIFRVLSRYYLKNNRFQQIHLAPFTLESPGDRPMNFNILFFSIPRAILTRNSNKTKLMMQAILMVKKILKYFASLSLFTKFVNTSFIIFVIFLASIIKITNDQVHLNYWPNLGIIVGGIITWWLLAIFFLSALYTIIGIVRLINEKINKTKKIKIGKQG